MTQIMTQKDKYDRLGSDLYQLIEKLELSDTDRDLVQTQIRKTIIDIVKQTARVVKKKLADTNTYTNRAESNTDTNSIRNAIIAHLCDVPESTGSKLIYITKPGSISTYRRALRKLILDGIVERVGMTRNASYRLIGK